MRSINFIENKINNLNGANKVKEGSNSYNYSTPNAIELNQMKNRNKEKVPENIRQLKFIDHIANHKDNQSLTQ